MGGCATKPKVLRDVPMESATEEKNDKDKVTTVVDESEKSENDNNTVVVSEEGNGELVPGVDTVNEIVVADHDQDQADKRRSLSHLFKESNETEEDLTRIEKKSENKLESIETSAINNNNDNNNADQVIDGPEETTMEAKVPIEEKGLEKTEENFEAILSEDIGNENVKENQIPHEKNTS